MKSYLLDLGTLLKVPYVHPYDWFDLSPDGSRVAFSYNLTGQWELYLMRLDGSAPPQRVTAGPGAKFAPRWRPGGQQLAYVLDLDGSEEFDMYLYDFATQGHTNLTPDTPYAIVPDYAWSPDGSSIAFISNRSGHFDTYVVTVAAGAGAGASLESRVRPVFSSRYPDYRVRWSPDGRWLAIVAGTSSQDYDTFIVPSEVGKPQVIAHASKPLHAKDARWSPDSTRIAFASSPHGFFDIGIYELQTGETGWVTEGEGDKEEPAWSPDGRRLAYVVGRGPITELAVLDLQDGSLATHEVEPGVHYQPRFTADGARVLLIFDSPRRPSDLWALDLTDGSFKQLTHSLPVALQGAFFAMPTTVSYPSLDGRSVPALLYRPPQDEDLPPAVVYVHGGPDWLAEVTWHPLVQHMVSRGWVVLAPNYRGSVGYGREWQLANRFDLGGGDTGDVVAGADYLIREGLADPTRIAVTGESYGGYLTMTSLTKYPDRWAVGSAVVPFLNWFTEFANERDDLQHWDRENFGDPEKDRDLFYERSPFFFMDRIAAPVQLICGAHDPRCPASESIQAHDWLVAQGKLCDLVLYEDEGHDFLKTENVVDAEKRRATFLGEILEGAAND
jgi:dipeptidyl aminopeptidase/acylaminoacyl peptidase